MFDPHKIMLKRKDGNIEDLSTNKPPTVTPYDNNDIKELQAFCQKYGIVGIGALKMSPRSILMMLKAKMGIRPDEKSVENINKTIKNNLLFG